MIPWKYVMLLSIVFLAVMSALAVVYENLILVILGFAISVPLTYVSKTRSVKAGEMIEDELARKISADASLLTMAIVMPIVAISAILLVILSDDLGEWAKPSGFSLMLVILLFYAVYMIIALYKSRRLSME